MSWIVLSIAGLLRVVQAVGLKYTHGFSRLIPSVIATAAMVTSMALLSWAIETLPVGTVCTVWTGVGTMGVVVTGIVLLGESASAMRIASLACIMVGIIGPKISAHQLQRRLTQISLLTSKPYRVAVSSICYLTSGVMVGAYASNQR